MGQQRLRRLAHGCRGIPCFFFRRWDPLIEFIYNADTKMSGSDFLYMNAYKKLISIILIYFILCNIIFLIRRFNPNCRTEGDVLDTLNLAKEEVLIWTLS